MDILRPNWGRQLLLFASYCERTGDLRYAVFAESALSRAQAAAGFGEVGVLLGEAEAEQVFARGRAGAVEGRTGDGGHSGLGEQGARLLRVGAAADGAGVGQESVRP